MRLQTIVGSMLLATLFISPLHAGNIVAVPEINPASLSGGLALLAGGSLFLLSRLRRK